MPFVEEGGIWRQAAVAAWGHPVRRVLFLFLDGLGVGPADPSRNPIVTTPLPVLRELLGGSLPTSERPEVEHPRRPAVAVPLDPLLGVAGLPQSGTGQTALFTGHNAPRSFGRHFGPWVPVRLRPLLAEQNLLSRAHQAGLSCRFANAYPRVLPSGWWARRPPAPPFMAHAAGLRLSDESDLATGEALSSEIVNTAWRSLSGSADIPEISPRQAGRNLGRLAAAYHLTLFAHYGLDRAGHTGEISAARQALARLDAFLGGLLDELPSDSLLVVGSDHGNIEEEGRGHTRNPAFTLFAGPGALEVRRGLRALTDLAPALLRYLGIAIPTG